MNQIIMPIAKENPLMIKLICLMRDKYVLTEELDSLVTNTQFSEAEQKVINELRDQYHF